jgi:hypothetical protein
MNPKVQIKMEYLNSLKPGTFVEDAQIMERFIGLYKQTHNGCTDDEAEDFYNRESLYFKQRISENNDLRLCTMFSLYSCFMDVVVNGLSFEPAAKLIYITWNNFNTAPRGQQDAWEKRAKNEISPFGELALRVQQGQILYCDDPVIVYSSDFWEPGYSEDGTRYSLYKAKIPRPADATIIGSFMKITRPNGSADFPFFTEENINEWRSASESKNKTAGANALYGKNGSQINIGFLKAKTIKHSFKTYPKIKIVGTNTQLEDAAIFEVNSAGQLEQKNASPVMPPSVEQIPAKPAENKPAAPVMPPPFSFTKATNSAKAVEALDSTPF